VGVESVEAGVWWEARRKEGGRAKTRHLFCVSKTNLLVSSHLSSGGGESLDTRRRRRRGGGLSDHHRRGIYKHSSFSPIEALHGVPSPRCGSSRLRSNFSTFRPLIGNPRLTAPALSRVLRSLFLFSPPSPSPSCSRHTNVGRKGLQPWGTPKKGTRCSWAVRRAMIWRRKWGSLARRDPQSFRRKLNFVCVQWVLRIINHSETKCSTTRVTQRSVPSPQGLLNGRKERSFLSTGLFVATVVSSHDGTGGRGL
jgi:hypothetical protein